MFNSESTSSLRSLNDVNAKPKRTSYGGMSTWFYMDARNSETDLDKSYLNFNDFDSNNLKQPSEYTLPVINNTNNNSKSSKLPAPREIAASPVVREYLMKNWSERRVDSNTFVPSIIDKRKGRSGSGGVWPNITQAFRENGNRLLFIEGPTYNRDYKYRPTLSVSSNNIAQVFPRTQSGRKITTALKDKFERERQGVQTKHGIEHGNWNLMR